MFGKILIGILELGLPSWAIHCRRFVGNPAVELAALAEPSV